MEEFIIYLEENLELAESIFNEYYEEQANHEGEQMMGDERFGGADSFEEEAVDLYEKFAHTTGHSAHYEGARGVIQELGVQSGFDVEDDDEEIQFEVLVLLDKEL